MAAVKLPRKDVLALMTTLEFVNADKWSPDRLQDRVDALADYVDSEGDELPELGDKDKKTLKKILDAIDDDTPIQITADEEEPEKLPKRTDSDDEEEDDDDDEPARPAAATSPKPTPAKPAPKASGPEEFVGIRELVAVLSRVASACECLVATMAGGKKPTVPVKPVSNGEAASPSRADHVRPSVKTDAKTVIDTIRRFICSARSEKTGMTRKEILEKIEKAFPTLDSDKLEKRVNTQLKYAMLDDGVNLKERAGTYWVEEGEPATASARSDEDDDD